MLTKEEAAQATGMKVREIVDIERVDGGYRVTTHDDQHIDLEAAGAAEPAAESSKAPARGRGKA